MGKWDVFWPQNISFKEGDKLEKLKFIESRAGSFMLQAFVSYWSFDKQFFLIRYNLFGGKHNTHFTCSIVSLTWSVMRRCPPI